MAPWTRSLKLCFSGEHKQQPKALITYPTDDEKLFGFQSGRWLWDEKEQLQKRHRQFNVIALQEIAISCVGAKQCISMTKISEVGGNKVFRLVMNNRKTVIARIPNRRASSGRLRLSSEVATMDFALNVLGLPVPKVLAWDASDACAVKAEYIVMEEARGTLLEEVWETMHPDIKAGVFDDLALISAKMQSISFHHIGNIYFASDDIPGATSAIAFGPGLSPALRAKIEERYVIGPTVAHEYWEGDRATIEGIHGPWRNPQHWLKAIAKREISWLEQFAVAERSQRPLLPSPKGTREEHIELWKKFEAASVFVRSIDPAFQRSTLWHGNLCATNIFVKKNKITAVIDWECCWATPLMFAAGQPALLLPSSEVLQNMTDPQTFAQLPPGSEKEKAATSIQWIYLRYAYQHALSRASPVFAQLDTIPLLLTLQQLLVQSTETWIGGAVALRDCLITLHDKWTELSPGKQCPYVFTKEELEQHATEEQSLALVAALMLSCRSVFTGDGFIDRKWNDMERIKSVWSELRENALTTLDDDQMRNEIVGALAFAVE